MNLCPKEKLMIETVFVWYPDNSVVLSLILMYLFAILFSINASVFLCFLFLNYFWHLIVDTGWYMLDSSFYLLPVESPVKQIDKHAYFISFLWIPHWNELTNMASIRILLKCCIYIWTATFCLVVVLITDNMCLSLGHLKGCSDISYTLWGK